MARRALGLLLFMPLLLAATFGPWEFEDTQNPVEQQTQGGATQPDHSLWVVNNTGCAWDADDSRSTGFTNSVLAAGETTTATKCLIVDGRDHGVWFHVISRSARLIAEIRFDPQGFVFRGNAVPVAGLNGYFEYFVCALGPKYDQSAVPTLPVIEGSNGGHGEFSTITVSITNPTRHAVRKTGSVMQLRATPSLASAGRCDYEDLPTQLGTYPGPFIRRMTS